MDRFPGCHSEALSRQQRRGRRAQRKREDTICVTIKCRHSPKSGAPFGVKSKRGVRQEEPQSFVPVVPVVPTSTIELTGCTREAANNRSTNQPPQEAASVGTRSRGNPREETARLCTTHSAVNTVPTSCSLRTVVLCLCVVHVSRARAVLRFALLRFASRTALGIHFISFHFISFHFISFHFISFHFISFHFISFHFILLSKV